MMDTSFHKRLVADQLKDPDFKAEYKRSRRSYELRWTNQQRRHTVKTQKRGRELMKAWKRWHERQGWWVTSVAQGYGYIARPPEWREDPLPGPRRAIILRETATQ